MLNDSQRTSLSIALRLVDQNIKKIETILEKPREVGVMYEIQDDLRPAMRELLPGKIEAVRALIKSLRDRFSLPREITPASREAFKGLPLLWEIIQEASSARLRRYGSVDARLGPLLDPELKKLETLVMKLEEILFVPRKQEASTAAGRRSSRDERRDK